MTRPSSPTAPGLEKKSRRSSDRRFLKRFLRPVGRRLSPILAIPALRILSSSWKTEVLGEENRAEVMNSEGSLFALWHGRMLVGLPSQTQLRMSVLVSPSRDGSIMDPILNSFSYATVRGSTSRGGARALRELLNRLRAGGRIVITPDGPRGPMHSMNEGLAWMARATGFPVLPVGLACDRHWSMSSWDRFTIPKWRAKIVVSYGPPLWLPKSSTLEERSAFTGKVRDAILAEEYRAFAKLGLKPDFDDESKS